MDRVEVKQEVIDFIESSGSLIAEGGNEYMCLPFWYKKVEGCIVEVYHLDQLPPDLKHMLKDEEEMPDLIPPFKGERGDFHWKDNDVVWIPDAKGMFLLLPDKCIDDHGRKTELGEDNLKAAEKRRKELWGQ